MTTIGLWKVSLRFGPISGLKYRHVLYKKLDRESFGLFDGEPFSPECLHEQFYNDQVILSPLSPIDNQKGSALKSKTHTNFIRNDGSES